MSNQNGFDRRDFLKGAVLGVAGILPVTSLIGCAPRSEAGATGAGEASVSGKNIPKVSSGDTPLSLEELNAFRRDLVDAQTDYTCADGVVIPAVYVKVRALFNSYSFGFGSEVHDRAFDEFIYLFNEEEAQAYLQMPYGKRFNAAEFATVSGRPEKECSALCEDLASRALLFRTLRAGIPYYHHSAMAYGMWEWRGCGDDSYEWAEAHSNVWGADAPDNKMGTLSPFYRSMPISKEVVADDEIYLYDDVEKIIGRHTVFGVAPCQCQKLGVTMGSIVDPATLLERCLVLGENAEYCIANGFAREITREEAIELLEYCREEGMVFQSVWTKEPDVICNCHKDICGILGSYRELGDAFAKYNTSPNVSHYDLVYDKEKCIKCAQCKDRCPVECITLDEEGYPKRNAACVRCGQCGLVCPQDARKLTLRDLVDVPDYSDTLLDDYNLKAEYRVRNGMLTL